ncbi:MAG: heme lyase CcmF/NrfE family subunit [Pseudomonadales bacterium]
MWVELGHFSLVICLVLSLALVVLPLWGSAHGNVTLMRSAHALATGQFVFVAIAMAVLIAAFVQDDFSVSYVANNSNSALPTYFKVSAVWGGHEGSLLLWVFILSGWTLAVAMRSDNLPLEMSSRVLSVMGMIAVGFLLFVLFTSNPFARELPFSPTEGKDLNPLLQDIGLIIHPPMLYMGYVGFSVAFSFAIAALIGGKLDAAWARWSRPWTNLAWAFLTGGITLGSWWAYYELGWGGWWFWDPVENASFMPWLVGTALIHSLAVTEKRGLFRSWTLLLAIFAFSLSLLGTFLVRSGVLTSVHAFASDPTRGLFILVFLLVVVGGSLLLYALRAPAVATKAQFSFWSRELFLLINNMLLLVATLIVLFGTLFPLLMDALALGKYSVGPPYFNALFVPLMAIAMAFMGIGPALKWKKNPTRKILQGLVAPLIASVILGVAWPVAYPGEFHWSTAMAAVLGLWVLATTLTEMREKVRHAPSFARGLSRLTRSYWGMVIAHSGIAVTAIGIGFTSQYSLERDIRMAPGEELEISGYTFIFEGTETVRGPNYSADMASLTFIDTNGKAKTLNPEKRRYLASGQVMTEAAIDAGFMRDIYIALGEPLQNGAWSMRIQVKPLVRWLWLGGFLMAMGGLFAITDPRYKRLRSKESKPSEILAQGV